MRLVSLAVLHGDPPQVIVADDLGTLQWRIALEIVAQTEPGDELLRNDGFELHGPLVVREVGVEIDRVATSSKGLRVWLEYKGSVQGSRPGLLRTDTLKKAIANGALLQAAPRGCEGSRSRGRCARR